MKIEIGANDGVAMNPPPDIFISDVLGEARRATASLADYVSGFTRPTLRLGVTGLARAGKTVFITALVEALISGGRLPVFAAGAEGRIRRAYLEPQPHDAVPRFAFEDHLIALTGPDRHWPESTRRISELRLVIEFERKGGWFGPSRSTLTLDIVDYPGEWLLDLALLEKSYAQWSASTIAALRSPQRERFAAPFFEVLAATGASAPADEAAVRRLAEAFTASLRACQAEQGTLSALPPGRFLMPGDLEGSPALTFAPLEMPADGAVQAGTVAAMMERRYEAYRALVVRPFFRDHFSRLDRQIVLVDALAALSSGPDALRDLEQALAEVLEAFKVGQNSLLTSLFAPRIEKVLFAATKADHLHHTSHDRLEGVLRMLIARASARASVSGAEMDVIALASVRATREMSAKDAGGAIGCIAGVPIAGETLDGERFDGTAEAAIFPGDLPADPAEAFQRPPQAGFKALRFRPPKPDRTADGRLKMLPSIRLDRALQFLIGDRLR